MTAMRVDYGRIRRQLHLGADRSDLVLLNHDGPVFDNAAGRDQGPAQCKAGGRGLG